MKKWWFKIGLYDGRVLIIRYKIRLEKKVEKKRKICIRIENYKKLIGVKRYIEIGKVKN